MRTPMLPFVDIVRCNGPLADKPVNTTLTSITDILDFYSRDLAVDSGHALMIRETASSLNLTEKADASESTIGDSPKEPVMDKLELIIAKSPVPKSPGWKTYKDKRGYPPRDSSKLLAWS